MPGSDVNVRTVEVAIETSAGKALGNLDALIGKLESLASTIDNAVSKAGGLSAIGKGAKGSSRISSTSNAMEKTTKSVSKANEQLDRFMEKMEKTGATGVEIKKSVSEIPQPIKDASKAASDMGKELKQASKEASKTSESLFGTGHGRTKKPEKPRGMTGIDRETMKEREESGTWAKAEKGVPFLNKEKELQQQTIEDYNTAKKYREEEAAIRKATAAIWERTRAKWQQAAADQEEFNRIENYKAAVIELENNNKRVQIAFNTLHNAVKRIFSVIGKLPSLFKKVGGAARSLATAIARPISTLRSMFGSGRSGGGLLGGLLGNKSLAKYIGLIALRRAVTGAIRAIVAGIKEGFENIRNYSSAINSEMNSIQNSLLYVKNAWAAAFAPIVSVVRPYINYLLDAIASALNAIGRLVAMLTGKGFAVQAVKLSDAMYEAGKAGKSAASGTGKATKAAEEYKKTIMGFDQLHVLNDQDSSGSSGGSGGGGGGGSNSGVDVSNMFTTVSLAGQLKDAINAENWDEVGKLLAEKVNSAFSKLDQLISWENVGEKITKSVTAITTTLNSLVDNIDWNLIGRTIGSGINTLVNTWNLFFDKFDFVNLGKKLAEGANGLFDRVNWAELGRAVTQKFKALWDTIYGFVTKLNWAKIGKSIGEFINGAMDNINLGTVASSIATTLNGITTSIRNFRNTVNWDELSQKISDFFGTFFEQWNVDDFISEIGGIAADIISTLADSAKEDAPEWREFGEKIARGLKTLPWKQILHDVAEIIISTLGQLLAGMAIELLPEGMRERLEALGWINTQTTAGATTHAGSLGQHGGSSGSVEIPVTANVTEINDKVPRNRKQIKESTAVEEYAKDNIPTSAKLTGNWTAKLGQSVDGIPKSNKNISNFNANVNMFNDGILSTNKKLGNYNALLTGNTDKIPGKNKTINNYKANVTSATLNVGSKTLDIGGRIVSVVKKPGLNPTIDVTANIRNTASNGWRLVPKANGGVFSGGAWKSITRYASGGMPQSAEIFMAREAGPELVGRIGSKTAVMNNNQIVSSVAAGVRQAVAEGMTIARGGEGGASPYEIHVTVKTQNDEVLARAVDRGYAKRKYRLGTAMG